MLTVLTLSNVVLTIVMIFMYKQMKSITKDLKTIEENAYKNFKGLKKEFQEAHVKALMLPPRWILRADDNKSKKESRK